MIGVCDVQFQRDWLSPRLVQKVAFMSFPYEIEFESYDKIPADDGCIDTGDYEWMSVRWWMRWANFYEFWAICWYSRAIDCLQIFCGVRRQLCKLAPISRPYRCGGARIHQDIYPWIMVVKTGAQIGFLRSMANFWNFAPNVVVPIYLTLGFELIWSPWALPRQRETFREVNSIIMWVYFLIIVINMVSQVN